MTDTEKRIDEIEARHGNGSHEGRADARYHAPADIKFLIAELRASQVECAKLKSKRELDDENLLNEEQLAMASRLHDLEIESEDWKQAHDVACNKWRAAEDERDAARAQLAEACEHIERMASEGVSRACGDDEAYAFLAKVKP